VRKQDAAWFVALGSGLLSVLALLRRRVRVASLLAVGAVGAGVASRRWSLDHKAPFPYSLRWILDFPHPITPELLRRGVEPSEGNHVLEIGPGTGRHAIRVAQWIAPSGTLDVFDVQQEMLDAVMRRADDQAVTNISPALGQAGERLPYPDARFDAAYLVTVIGEIPDPDMALRELHRVLRPAGRLAVAEVIVDPDYTALGELRSRAEACGFRFVQRLGSPLAYVAQFEVA
jgi:SAM-dependent methyltransferase